jgi:hypothetical protein
MEYAGYQASTPIDWSKLTGGLVKTIQDIGADREKKRQDLDKLAEENIKVLQNAELGKSQNVQDLTLQGSSYGRDKIVMWNRMLKNGQLNPVEYRRNINNLNGTWTTFANAAKTFDAQLEELQKRQIPGEDGFIPGDKFEAYKSLKLAQLADLKGKRMEVDSNGNFLMVKENPDGTYDPENVVDFRSAFKPNNFRSDNINLSKVLDIQTKNIADVVKESGATTITDALQLPAVVSTISNVKGAILSNPRQAAAVLTNNSSGNYDYYSNKDEYNANIQNRIDKENDYRKISGKEKLTTDEVENFVKDQKKFMILVQADDQGVDQPVLDKDQYEVAGKVIEDGFKARLDYKKELDEPNYGGSGGGGSDAKDQAISDIAKRVYSATKMSDKNEAAKQMSIASGGKYVFKYDGNVLNVYTTDATRGELVKQNETPLNSGEKWANNLWAYFPVTDTEWIKDIDRLRQSGGSKPVVNKTTKNDPLGLGL